MGDVAVGEEHACDAEPADARDPEPVQAGHEEEQAQTAETRIVWPMSGCMISGTMVSGSSIMAMSVPGTSRRRAPSEKAQAARMTKAGHEFGRLEAEDPAARALDLDSEQQRRHDEAHAGDV